MAIRIVAFIIFSLIFSCNGTLKTEMAGKEEYPFYDGHDLGVSFFEEFIQLKIWAPTAEVVMLNVYEQGDGGDQVYEQELEKTKAGTWTTKVPVQYEGYYYTFQVKYNGIWLKETPDPYAVAVGINGQRGMLLNLSTTNPLGWEEDLAPPLKGFEDIILYELHIRDLSTHPNSQITHAGKYLGFTESGTRLNTGEKTGIDHIKELGVTHVHLLPIFDFAYLDESDIENQNFNWGYAPQNYNAPEGSYAMDVFDGRNRIIELKQLIQSLHQKGLRVVMDVAYNHTFNAKASSFEQIVPGYYYRYNEDGSLSNATACGNEVASEQPMVRQFIIQSLLHWVNEYHIDGFRFDLMGVHDIQTMKAVETAIHQVDSSIILYGEGWAAGESPLPIEQRAIKENMQQLNGIAAFSDDLRDGIRGHVFTEDDQGFIACGSGLEETIKFGVVGSTFHPQVDYNQVKYSKKPWANSPLQCINYASCHDNHTLWDRIMLTAPDLSEKDKIKMHQLALTIVLTSQGIPFIHAGSEFVRTKYGVENSFESPDSINQIDWSRKRKYFNVFQYTKDLIALRNNHPALKMKSPEMIQENLQFLEIPEKKLVAFKINGGPSRDPWKHILIAYNGNDEEKTINIPNLKWKIAVKNGKVDENGLGETELSTLHIPASSAMILYSNDDK